MREVATDPPPAPKARSLAPGTGPRVLVADDNSVVLQVAVAMLGQMGCRVTAVSGGLTGTTDAAGAYSILSVTTGPKTLSLSNLPAGCVDPGTQNTTVTNGGTSTVNYTVPCATPTGC